MNTMRVEDFIVLGRTVPEESRKYGKRICMAGFSKENNQFLRVYPLLVPVGENADSNGFRARFRYSLDLRRNENDNRAESWRLQDENNPSSTAWNRAVEVKPNEMIDMLDRRVVRSIHVLNECRLSLGVLKLRADEWEGISVPRDHPEDEHQASLFDDLDDQSQYQSRIDPRRIKFAPYIRFTDDDGEHRLQVREWGAYILLSNPKYAEDPDALWARAAYKRGLDTLIVVGNMNNHRKNWLIIKTFQMKKPEAEPDLFSLLGIDGEGDKSEG